jgi:hypothetical protein
LHSVYTPFIEHVEDRLWLTYDIARVRGGAHIIFITLLTLRLITFISFEKKMPSRQINSASNAGAMVVPQVALGGADRTQPADHVH